MLVIRLSRTGRKKYPTYRIVAADSKRAATGKFVMILGHYNPHTKELVIKKEETISYLKNGAQPSNAVIKLLKQEKVDLPDWAQLKTRSRKAKKEAPAEAPAAAAPADEVATEEATSEAETAVPEAVAEVAQEEVAAIEDNAVSDNVTETVSSDEVQVEKAEAAEEAAAEVADKPAAE